MRNARFSVLLLLALAAPGCAGTEPKPIVIDRSMGVLLPDSETKDMIEPCSRVGPGPVDGAWAPAPEQIVELEDGLAWLLARKFHKLANRVFMTAWVREVINHYYRQYVGVVLHGRRIVYVNAFADVSSPPPTWRTKTVLPCDDGWYGFGIEYDPETKAFANFHWDSNSSGLHLPDD